MAQEDDDLNKQALMQQLAGGEGGAAAMSQDPQGNWSLQEHGNTRALQGQEVDDAKKYVSDLAAQRQPQVAAPVAEGAPMGMADTQPMNEQMPRNPLAAIGGALKPSAVLNPLSAQNPLAPKNVAQALSPQGINRVLGPQAIGQALAPKNVHQNMKNILNPRNILHPKEAFRRIFGGG